MAAKVRFGIQTGQDGVEWSHLRDFWQFLDKETAFHSVWTIDHFVPPGPGQEHPEEQHRQAQHEDAGNQQQQPDLNHLAH